MHVNTQVYKCYLLGVLLLRCQSGLYALPGLHKSLSLSNFTWIMSQNASNIGGQIQNEIGLNLKGNQHVCLCLNN